MRDVRSPEPRELVVRMVVKTRSKPANKVLIRQDGYQLAAQVGMVDKSGVMFNVVDVGSKYMEFAPMSTIVAEKDRENEQLRYDLASACEVGERAINLFERTLDLCDELIEEGKFPIAKRNPYLTRLWKLRRALEEMVKDVV